jgi:branched-chain amino acid transport system ATP-binding protein
VVLVEQRVDAVLKLADRVAFMVAGRIEKAMPRNGLTADADVFRTYVGV